MNSGVMLWTFERTADTWTPSEALLYNLEVYLFAITALLLANCTTGLS